MTPDEFVIKVNNLENYLQGDLEKQIVLGACNDLVARIAGRVQETSVLGSGRSYDYSTKPTLVGRKSFLPNKDGVFKSLLAEAKSKKENKSEIHWVTLNKTGKNGKKIRLIVLPGGYAELRRREGNLNTKKNYSRSTDMWKGFKVVKADDKEVIMGGVDELSQKKINWNSKRDDDIIIAPNQQEIDILKEQIRTGIIRQFNAALGS